MDTVVVLKDLLSEVGVPELTLLNMGVLKTALGEVGMLEAAMVPVAVTADPAPVVVTADPAADPAADHATEPTALTAQDPEAPRIKPLPLPATIVRGLGLATVKLEVTIKGTHNFRLGCPFLAPSSTLGPSPFPWHPHLALGPNI